jgi:hypothetical protein
LGEEFAFKVTFQYSFGHALRCSKDNNQY